MSVVAAETALLALNFFDLQEQIVSYAFMCAPPTSPCIVFVFVCVCRGGGGGGGGGERKVEETKTFL